MNLDVLMYQNDNGTVAIYSQIMNCEYVVTQEKLGAEIARLYAEFNSLREADML